MGGGVQATEAAQSTHAHPDRVIRRQTAAVEGEGEGAGDGQEMAANAMACDERREMRLCEGSGRVMQAL